MKKRLVTVMALVVLVGSGCGVFSSDSEAEALAERLAAALGEHSLEDVPLVSAAARDTHAELVAPLDDHRVDVSVEDVAEEGDSAEVTLGWSWNLRGHEWRYTSTARLVDDGSRWEVDWAPNALEPSLEEGDRLATSTRPAERGRILGQGDQPLVEDRPVLRHGLDKTRIEPGQAVASARQIAAAVGIDAQAYEERVLAAGPQAFVEALTVRADEVGDHVDPAYDEIPGAVALADQLPLAPSRDFAAELLGRVGPATAEVIEQSGGRIEAGDLVGLSGLQKRYDEELTGIHGIEVVAVSADEDRRSLFEAAPTPGQDLRTTLDAALQAKAEQTLAALGDGSQVSALVAMRPSDGHVVAAANGAGDGGPDVALAGQYAPGSTFKVVTALALLRAGVAPDGTLPCPATVEVDGRVFENYDDYPVGQLGGITFTSAIAHSCNTALIAARDRLEGDDLAQAAAALGLGADHDLGVPAYLGQVPPPSGATEHAAALIGQGKVLASPMAMATVASSVVAGRAVVPTILIDSPPEPATPETPLTEAESRTLQDMMRAVVAQGSGRFLADLPGEVGAKTGTAEHGAPGPDGALDTHAWMIGFRGDLAVAVFVEKGDSGSGTAGPLLESFLR